jgi:hypothetical protein
MAQRLTPRPSDESRTTLGRRSFSAGVVGLVAASAAAASTVHASHARAATERPRVVGAYTQLTADGEYVGLGMEGVQHAMAAFAAMHQVTRSARQRMILEALVERVLERSPTYMGHLFGVQVLSDPFLLSHPQLRDNIHRYATSLVERFATNPDQLLRHGDIRTLTGNASFLIAYARFRERDASKRGDDVPTVKDVDTVALASLDRVVELQLTLSEATGRFGNPRLAGGFPHLVEGPDGSMGSWDVRTWSPVMLSLDQYAAVRALAEGFGRYRHPSYRHAAAAGARLLLATTDIDPSLVYAGEPPGFPLDGAELAFGEETGEMPYAITYGWSPNAVANLGTALRALLVYRVTVPRSRAWTEAYWRGTPPTSVLDARSFWAGLAAKIALTHRFVEATQLPVPPDFPWIDLPRATFPGTGDDDLRRGGWYDGSGRGAMSAVYARIELTSYVASGGRDAEMLLRAGRWWESLLVWE